MFLNKIDITLSILFEKVYIFMSTLSIGSQNPKVDMKKWTYSTFPLPLLSTRGGWTVWNLIFLLTFFHILRSYINGGYVSWDHFYCQRKYWSSYWSQAINTGLHYYLLWIENIPCITKLKITYSFSNLQFIEGGALLLFGPEILLNLNFTRTSFAWRPINFWCQLGWLHFPIANLPNYIHFCYKRYIYVIIC